MLSTHSYPRSIHELPAIVRAKAREIADALIAEGSERERAQRIGVAAALRWATAQSSPPQPRARSDLCMEMSYPKDTAWEDCLAEAA